MDADSSYGGSDTAQDCNSTQENNSSLDTTIPHHEVEVTMATLNESEPQFYHKNEVTLPVNYDETDDVPAEFAKSKEPHYLSTANLNINETLEHHSNLEEMSRNYKSTNYLNAESPKIKDSSGGVDNMAYQDEEMGNGSVKSTFDSKKPYNGDYKKNYPEINMGTPAKAKQEEPPAEAVNLELINLKPNQDVTGPYAMGNGSNGMNGMTEIPMKKERDETESHPYNDYFVPVNEHKKYMRGEKLYLTMDKRNKKSKGKCICWGLCICVVAALIIVAICAAVGVFSNQAAQPITARNFHTASVLGVGSNPGNSSEVRKNTPSPPLSTIPNIPPSTETTAISIPRTLESQMRIDNFEFMPDLSNKSSKEFQTMASKLENEIMKILISDESLKNANATFKVKVVDFTIGSIVVKYRISWDFKDDASNSQTDPIDPEMLKKKVSEMLTANNEYIQDFHVPKTEVTSNKVLDLCKIDNNDCEHDCLFDYESLDFTCTCPPGQSLKTDGKTCEIHVHQEWEDHAEHVYEPNSEPVPKTEPEPTAEPTSKPEPSAEPEPTSEPEPKSEPEPSAEPTSEPEPKSEPEPTSEPTSKPEPSAEPEPTAEPEPKSEPEPSAEPTAEPEPKSEPEPTAEPESKVEHLTTTTIRTHEEYFLVSSTPEPLSEPEPTSEPEPKSEPEPTAEPTAEPEPKSEPEPTVEPLAEPEPTSEPEPKSEPEPTAEPSPEPEPKSEPETTAEPSAEPEPTSEPELKLESKSTVEQTSKPEPSAEPEPTSEPNAEPTSKPEPSAEPETTSEPNAEPTSKPEPSAEPEATSEPEPTSEPTSKPEPEPKSVPETTVEPKSEPEPTAEPEPSSEKSESEKADIQVDLAKTEEPMNKETTVEPTETTTSEDDSLHIYIPKAEIRHSPTTTEEPSTTLAMEPAKETMIEEIPKIKEESRSEQSTTTEKAVEDARNQGFFIPVIVGTEHNQTTTIDVTTTPETSTIPLVVNDIPVVVKSNIQAIKSNNTSQESNLLLEQTEHPNIVDMNPFLPYIDNDTSFINTLGSDDHFIGHHIIQNETESSENENDNKPPRLDNDQINITNPQDPNPTDTAVLKVEPLDNEAKEDTSPSSEITTMASTTIATEVKMTTMPTMEAKEEEVTLNPEFINSIHSNKVFEQSILQTEQPSSTTTTEKEVINMSEVSSSTEDLIALETTTNGLKMNMDNMTSPLEGTTIHAEIIKTVNEVVNVVNDSESTTSENNLSSTTEAAKNEYKVNESTDDITTTEKLFVLSKATTKSNDIDLSTNQDLSVEPLTKDNSLHDEDTFNQLDSDDSNNFNELDKAITTEEPVTIASDETEKYQKPGKKSYLDDKSKFKAKLDKEMMITTEEYEASTNIADVKPVTEDFTLHSFSRCTSEQFQCQNGTATKNGSYCISIKDRCDSVDDCTDGSDEVNCQEEGCPNNFKCASGQCLKRHLVCDGVINCNDGTDEEQCALWTCSSDEISCGEGKRCIPSLWKCDGKAQCPNGSDEINCQGSTCQDDHFYCKESDKCIPRTWLCDGESDCADREDEQSCECAPEEFKCATVSGCTTMEQRCNGIYECLDRSDEWDCLRLNNKEKNVLEVQAKNNTWYPVCFDNLNETYANLACEALGFAGSASVASMMKPEGLNVEGYYKLKAQLTYGAPILTLLEKTESCTNIVSLNCQEFSCGSESSVESQSPRIIGGSKATDTQWPSLALLYNKKENVQCTATVISPLWVAASYSCVTSKDARDWMLYAGSTSFFGGDNSTTQSKRVKEIVVHPQTKFVQFQYNNDVVLVRLDSALTLTRNVSAICLPDKDIEPRQLCVIAGWGVSQPGESNKQQYLHYLPIPLVDTEECNSTKHYNGMINKDKICAGFTDPEKTPCYNDEGAPLMCFEDSTHTWELQGVLSHNENCGKSKHPAIYTAINEKLRQWVLSTVGRPSLMRSV
ncbi:unnamed protein product [Brassicogethes aeneus]|uniref:Uncharacterized protein n=1 Tax=Brassicogethes aeneus TaxID=1431903 RepID=A0A9P0B648_BRAAE|nr:unnamed protein product [Brassicogethes aeneus]